MKIFILFTKKHAQIFEFMKSNLPTVEIDLISSKCISPLAVGFANVSLCLTTRKMSPFLIRPSEKIGVIVLFATTCQKSFFIPSLTTSLYRSFPSESFAAGFALANSKICGSLTQFFFVISLKIFKLLNLKLNSHPIFIFFSIIIA